MKNWLIFCALLSQLSVALNPSVKCVVDVLSNHWQFEPRSGRIILWPLDHKELPNDKGGDDEVEEQHLD
jgi:hypothetical protein